MTHPWMPVSRCGAACFTREEPMVPFPGRLLRWVGLLAVLVLVCGAVPVLLYARAQTRERVLRRFARLLLAVCGVRLRVHGRLDGRGRGALVVHNHISWLDVLALFAVRPTRTLAKSEIGSWPVLGAVLARAGSVFVHRQRLSGLPGAVDSVADTLRDGELVTVTPEGTTWCGRASGPFRPALFQAAVDAGVPVQPVALRYRLESGRETTRPAFLGADSLLESLRRTLALRGLVVDVVLCPEIAPGRAGGRRELAALAQDAVAAELGATAVRSYHHGRTRDSALC